MPHHTIRIIRSPQGSLSHNSPATDALTGGSSIPGVLVAEIASETENEVAVSFAWDGRSQFQSTDKNLARHHVQKVWE